MGPLTYKVFNLYSFIRCGTYNSHLHTTTLPLKCESIYSSCSPLLLKLLLCMYRRCWFLRKWSDIVALCANKPVVSVVPFVERGSDTFVRSLRRARGTTHIEARTTAQARETPHSYPKP